MPRQPLRAAKLRENPAAAPAGAEIIDVNFTVVRGRKRSWRRRIGAALFAILLAALIGFAIPPVILLANALWPGVGPV